MGPYPIPEITFIWTFFQGLWMWSCVRIARAWQLTLTSKRCPLYWKPVEPCTTSRSSRHSPKQPAHWRSLWHLHGSCSAQTWNQIIFCGKSTWHPALEMKLDNVQPSSRAWRQTLTPKNTKFWERFMKKSYLKYNPRVLFQCWPLSENACNCMEASERVHCGHLAHLVQHPKRKAKGKCIGRQLWAKSKNNFACSVWNAKKIRSPNF